jgi:hypothetical protein
MCLFSPYDCIIWVRPLKPATLTDCDIDLSVGWMLVGDVVGFVLLVFEDIAFRSHRAVRKMTTGLDLTKL